MSSLRRIPRLILTIGGLFCLSSQSHALNPGDVVDNFRLIDQAGRSHELYYLSDMKAVVLLAYDAKCDAAASAARAVDALRGKHAQQVATLMIDSSLSVSGYDFYARGSGGTYTFALIAPVAIGANTTAWLNSVCSRWSGPMRVGSAST